MKMPRTFLAWPLIFAATGYFSSFQIGVIVSLAYLHVVTILLFQITEKQKDKFGERIWREEGFSYTR
ncbi:MAG: hypothetical protein WCG31_10360 [Deltaproteobacteria bacterium]